MSVVLHMGRKDGVWITFRNYSIVPIDIHSLLAYSFGLWFVIMCRNMFANFKHIYEKLHTLPLYDGSLQQIMDSHCSQGHALRTTLQPPGSTDGTLLLHLFIFSHGVSGGS